MADESRNEDHPEPDEAAKPEDWAPITRRRFLGAATMGTTLTVTGCGSDSEGATEGDVEPTEPMPDDPVEAERWRDRYLRGWEELAPYEVTSHLFELVEPLASMHQVITYGWLLDSLDPSERWQFGSAMEDWLTRALDARTSAG